ncbi:polysaccharide deacetylase [Candidatus Vecturithrix granuli]|uniref:Polysaccharide deacetylase n=1 Tax=Vecturithrix granuli TaxID=1499967 RepID=A0A0S6W9W7_VECG1|nr:polysaccharide deacetylase [Candidatus Vecturithrix granuli]
MKIFRHIKQRVYQWRQRFQPNGMILLYHRITELQCDPQLLSVSPQHFEDHLQIITQFYRPHHLTNITQCLSLGHVLPRRSVIITFDDGYADNLHHAKPLLEQYQIPATMFVSSGETDRSREFWWDALEYILLHPHHLPEHLELTIQGSANSWSLGDAVRYPQDSYQCYRDWNVLHSDTPTLRHQLYRSLCSIFRCLPVNERTAHLEALFQWAGLEPTARLTHCRLTPTEIPLLVTGGLITIGAHTAHHLVLSTLSPEQQRQEIWQNKQQLELLSGQSVEAFAYPYGTPGDYNQDSITILQELGFKAVCSNFPGLLTEKIDRFQLPRFIVRNWPRDQFAHQLQTWFKGEQ